MNGERSPHNLAVGPLVAAVGAVLLIVSLFLPWYETDVEAFTVFEFIDLLLLLTGVATIAVLVTGFGLLRAPPPGASLGVALLALFVVVSQILNDPPAVAFNEDIGKEIGIWLALAGSALMVAGSVLGFARISLAVETRAPRRDQTEPPTRPLDEPGDPRARQR